MRFSDWLKQKEIQEVSTSTGEIAHFARPFLTGGWREYPPVPLTADDGDYEWKRKKKTERKENYKKNL